MLCGTAWLFSRIYSENLDFILCCYYEQRKLYTIGSMPMYEYYHLFVCCTCLIKYATTCVHTYILTYIRIHILTYVLSYIHAYFYLSIRVFNSCRRLPETKRHSSLFLHWSGSKFLVVRAACTPSIHVFLGRPLFLLSRDIQSIINFGILSSGILLTWPYHCSLFFSMMWCHTYILTNINTLIHTYTYVHTHTHIHKFAVLLSSTPNTCGGEEHSPTHS